MPLKVKLTQAIVRELLDYAPCTGLLTWRSRNTKWFLEGVSRYTAARSSKIWNIRFAGKLAFTAELASGARVGRLFDKSYLAHRVIWLWMTGAWPRNEIDHEDQNPGNNKWMNLRDSTSLQQKRNCHLYKNNKTGVPGVRLYQGTYLVSIGLHGKGKRLGSFRDFNLAVAARKRAERQYGFSKRHGQRRESN